MSASRGPGTRSQGEAATTMTSVARRVLISGTACVVIVMLPPFLLGAHATVVRQELEFGPAALGVTVGVFFACSALASIPGGRLSERLGARKLVLFGVGLACLTMLAVAVLVDTWRGLTVAYGIAGLANGAVQPATNHLLANGMPTSRQSDPPTQSCI